MADLTATLSDAGDAARIIEAPAESSGLATALSGLRQGLSAFAASAENSATRKRQAAADARAAQDQQNQQADRAARDAVVRTMAGVETAARGTTTYETLDQITGVQEPLAIGDDLKVSVGQAASKMQTYKVAVDQGKMNATALRALQYQAFNRILTEHPEYNAAVVAAQFKELGVDSFKEYNTQVSEEDKQRDFQRKLREEDITLGRSLFPAQVGEGMTDDDFARAGRDRRALETRLKFEDEEKARVRADNAETRTSLDFDRAEMGRDVSGRAWEYVTTTLNPLMQQLIQAQQGAGEQGTNPAFEVRLSKTVEGLRNAKNVIIGNAIQNIAVNNPGVDVSTLRSNLEKQYDGYLNSVEQGRQSYLSAAKVIGTSLNMRAEQAFPMLAQLRSLGIGYEAASVMFQNMPQELVQRFARTFKNGDKGVIGQSVERIQMSNLIAAAAGETTIASMDTNSARTTVQTFVPMMYKESARVARGQSDGQLYMNAFRNVVLATGTDQSNGSIDKAGSAIFRTDNITALNRLMADGATREEATTLARASRASAAVLTTRAHGRLDSLARSERWFKPIWDSASNQFKLQFDRAAYKKAFPNGSGGSGLVAGALRTLGGSAGDVTPKPSLELQMLLKRTNEGIDYLASTVKWDDDSLSKALDKTSYKERTAFYAGQGTPASVRDTVSREKGAPKSATDILDSIDRSLTNIPAAMVQDANADIIGPEGTGKNPRSSAVGVGQFTNDTWLKTLQRHAPELIQGKSRADILAMRQNKELARRAVGWLRGDNAIALGRAGVPATAQTTALAHFAGAAGATALLKADPSTPASELLAPGAIQANPHLAGKTAGQVIQWAKRFYKS